MNDDRFSLWCRLHHAPYHFPMAYEVWEKSMFHDIDSDGRVLFSDLTTECTNHAMIQYGHTAFGFDGRDSYPLIRFLSFDEENADDGQQLLDRAMAQLGSDARVYAFFHYFGMSACGRHGKLHEKDAHVEKLLLQNGFIVEHENVYYSRVLEDGTLPNPRITLSWKERSAGDCREFAANSDGKEIGWGQVHFLPQGDIAYLRWIYIDAPCQHRGFGKAIMHALFSDLLNMGIRRFDTDTALDNHIAQRYYEKCGFTNKGITRSYYTK